MQRVALSLPPIHFLTPSKELRRPYNFEKKDSAIKIEIFKCLASLTKNCGKKMNDFMGDLLPVVSTLLTSTVRGHDLSHDRTFGHLTIYIVTH